MWVCSKPCKLGVLAGERIHFSDKVLVAEECGEVVSLGRQEGQTENTSNVTHRSLTRSVMQISTRLFSTCMYRQYRLYRCFLSAFLFFEDFMTLAANPSPGNLTAEFTQDLDKVALPAMSVVQSSDREPLSMDPEVSGGFFTRLVPNTSCTGRKERRKRFEWNTPKSQQVSFGRLQVLRSHLQ